MRNLLLLVIFALSFGHLAAQDAAPSATFDFADHPARVVGNINGLNVRSSPAIETDNIVGRLQPGQQVHVLARDGDWQQVRGEDGLLGWSHSDYLIDRPPRQIGDKRRFDYGQAVLQYIGRHSYIYFDESDFGSEHPIGVDPAWLQRLGQEFDQRIYPETLALWNAVRIPSHEGDERIVVLIIHGGGGYRARSRMPEEPHPTPDRIGFITSPGPAGLTIESTEDVLTHELQHLFQHQVDRLPENEEYWVHEGLATFGALYLGYAESVSSYAAGEFFARPQTQLTDFRYEVRNYGASLLFTTYIYEQLGLQAWQSFATHPARGLDALAAVLDEIGSDRDVDSFFADWVLANYLHEERLADPRYRYQLLESARLSAPITRQTVTQLPARIQDSSNQYATHYYDLWTPTSGQEHRLTLALQLVNPSVQDAWLQLVQIIDGEVHLQRFRASEFRDQTIDASIETGAERTFLAISPFRTDDRSLTAMQDYSLEINIAGSGVDGVDYAAQDAAQDAVTEFTDHPARVVTNINGPNVRRTPAIESDNIVGRLQPGQQVQVIAREGDWQQVRGEDGLLGWSHSDYLVDLPPRQLGETRQFLLNPHSSNVQIVHAQLRHIGKHSYIYFAEHPGQSIGVNWNEVRAFAEVFDEHIYPETIALWDPDPRPSHEGDERIVILFTVGFKHNTGAMAGFHHHRDKMPEEPHPHDNRTGFIEITWHNGITPDFLYQLAAHELQHLTQHHFDADEACWVHEGFSVFNSAYLGYLGYQRHHAADYLDLTDEQLNRSPADGGCDYGPGFVFATYILEQLGLEALRDFARRPENGLAAMDALLAERGGGLDTETFFADFVLANYLRDTQLADGQFGYQMLDSLDLLKPHVEGRITALPILAQERLYQFATEYYEIALSESDQALDLELALQLPDSFSSDGWDGWLQLVQVVDGEVSLQRFRASEYRDQMMTATLQPDAEQAFLAISLFRDRDKDIVAIAPYTLQVHLAGSDATTADYATVAPAETTNLAALSPQTEQKSPVLLASAVVSVINEYAKNEDRLRVRDGTAEMDQYVARVQELLDAGADMRNTFGGQAVLTVVSELHQSHELLALLLDAGANPNTSGLHTFAPGEAQHIDFTSTPLNYAVFFQDAESVQLLLAAGASVNSSSWRVPALHLASITGNTRIIELLLAAGADPNFKAVGGQTAADFARQHGHHAAARMLEAAAAN